MITGTTVELIQISKLILCYKGIVDLLACVHGNIHDEVQAGDV